MGVQPISAFRVVDAPPEDVFDFLSSLENHWRLVDRFVVVVSVDGAGAVVRLRGPFGLRRTARTRVTSAVRPHAIVGVAELRGGTRARVTWTLEPAGAGAAHRTHVRLAAEVERAGWLDRLVLTLGGREWMRRRFTGGLARLAARYGA